MNENTQPTAAAPAIAGLAVASLVLGIIAVFTSFLAVGIIAGLLGVIFGWVHLARATASRGMAVWGVVLSLVGMLLGGVFVGVYCRFYTRIHESAGQEENEPDFAAWEGVAAPDLDITALDGRTFKLSELKGRRVVLDFWATWCPPCRMEIPHFVQLAKENDEDHLLIVGISNEDEDKLKPFVDKNGMNYPVASLNDEDLPAPYNLIRAIPTTFFVDRNGILQHIVVGYHDLDALKEMALADDYVGEPVPAPAE